MLIVARFEFGIAEGGRFCDSSRCLAVIPELEGEFSIRPFTPAFVLAVPLVGEFPNRPAVVVLPFIV